MNISTARTTTTCFQAKGLLEFSWVPTQSRTGTTTAKTTAATSTASSPFRDGKGLRDLREPQDRQTVLCGFVFTHFGNSRHSQLATEC